MDWILEYMLNDQQVNWCDHSMRHINEAAVLIYLGSGVVQKEEDKYHEWRQKSASIKLLPSSLLNNYKENSKLSLASTSRSMS